MRDGGLGVVIGDVSGHGFGPALLMAELRAYLRALLLTRADVGKIVGRVTPVAHRRHRGNRRPRREVFRD